jgi:hypothetical protein
MTVVVLDASMASLPMDTHCMVRLIAWYGQMAVVSLDARMAYKSCDLACPTVNLCTEKNLCKKANHQAVIGFSLFAEYSR